MKEILIGLFVFTVIALFFYYCWKLLIGLWVLGVVFSILHWIGSWFTEEISPAVNEVVEEIKIELEK